MMPAGERRHRITFQTLDPVALAVSSVTRAGSTATVVTTTAHGYATDDRVSIAGATPAAYNGTVVITVLSTTSFSYTVSGNPSTPATGTITATYVSDRLGAPRRVWRDLFVGVRASKLALSGRERIAAGGTTSEATHEFGILYRSDVTTKLRVVESGVPYEVEAVLDRKGDKRELAVLAVERQDQAA